MTVLSSPSTQSVYRPIPAIQDPLWLQMLLAVFRPMAYLERCRARYGDIFIFKSPNTPTVVTLSHPKAIEAVFTADQSQFRSGPGNITLQPLVGSQSLLHADGAVHQRKRKLLMPPFHGQRVYAYGQKIQALTQQVVNEWQPQQVFPIHRAMQTITLQTILHVVFGLSDSPRYVKLHQLIGDWLDSFQSPWRSLPLFVSAFQKDLGAWSPWGQFLRRKHAINQLLLAEIQERRQKPIEADVLSLLLEARDEAGEGMGDAELRDELLTLLFAGHETTASALAWAFYWIHRLPDVKEKLLAELATLGDDPDPGEIMKLPYLNAVCQETLRIYPVAFFTFGRITTQPFEFMDYRVEAGMMLTPCIYLMHQRPELYPEPEQFRPERFLERSFSPYEYIPFGGGNRRCLGYAFAQFEMKLVLVTVLRQCSLVLASDRPTKPVRRGVTFTPSRGVPMQLQAHRSQA